MKTLSLRGLFSKFAVCLGGVVSAPLSAHAQSTWTGAVDSSYGTAGNWSPSGVPNTATNVIINTSSPNGAVTNGNFDRRGAGTTTISGTGSVNVTGGQGRLLNNGVFNMQGGTITQTGEYFIVGVGGVGTFNQSGGSITSTLQRSFQFSDNNLSESGSVYNLSGGTLTVNSAASGAVGEDLRGFWLGKGGGGAGTALGDLFDVTGGSATFTRTGSNEANVRISRNSGLEISAGTVTFANYSNFWVGAANAGTTNSRIVLDGGTLNITGGTSLYIGREDDGKLTINSGILDLSGTLVLGGDGTGAFDGIGMATMTGGSLFASSIDALNAGSIFNFSGGTITLNGNQVSIIGESWFSGAAGTFATYDALNDITIIAVPESSTCGIAVAGFLGALLLIRRRRFASSHGI